MMQFFHNNPDVISYMSLRKDGTMKMTGEQEYDGEAHSNRMRFLESLNINPDHVVSAELSHSDNIYVVETTKQKCIKNTDALITTMPSIFLAITVADCYPVFFYEPEKKICAIAHVGWRGVVKKIIPKTIVVLKDLGADITKMRVENGPGISQANFMFGERACMEQFGFYCQDKFVVPSRVRGKVHVNLQALIHQQLEESGVARKNIIGTLECTYAEPEHYFSARYDKTDPIKAMLALIGRKDES